MSSRTKITFKGSPRRITSSEKAYYERVENLEQKLENISKQLEKIKQKTLSRPIPYKKVKFPGKSMRIRKSQQFDPDTPPKPKSKKSTTLATPRTLTNPRTLTKSSFLARQRKWYSPTPLKENIKKQEQKSTPFGEQEEFDIEKVMGYSPKSPEYSKWNEIIKLPKSSTKFDLKNLEQILEQQLQSKSSPTNKGLKKVNLRQVFPKSNPTRAWFEPIDLSPKVSRKLFSKPERIKKNE
jgi:uncharacterized protein (UPF0335 family)